jgi:hypothetical protein
MDRRPQGFLMAVRALRRVFDIYHFEKAASRIAGFDSNRRAFRRPEDIRI